MEVCPDRITPSTGTHSPGSTRRVSPTCTCSAGITLSAPPRSTRAVRGVRCTSFSMPARALATVSSSSRPPSCMMKATSPAAKSWPMHTEAISARDTSTSALMSKAVTRPMMASSTMGTPHRMMAIHAISKEKGCHFARLQITAMPEITSSVTSFLMPPHSSSPSSFSISAFMLSRLLYTVQGMGIIYPYRYHLSSGKERNISAFKAPGRKRCGREGGQGPAHFYKKIL